MIAIIVGLALVGLGLVGVRYAPAIVATQHRQGATPLECEEIDRGDRVRVTRGTGVVLAAFGLGLLAYGFDVV